MRHLPIVAILALLPAAASAAEPVAATADEVVAAATHVNAVTYSVGVGMTSTYPAVSGMNAGFDFRSLRGAAAGFELGLEAWGLFDVNFDATYQIRAFNDLATGDLSGKTIELASRLGYWIGPGVGVSAGLYGAFGIGGLSRSDGTSISYSGYGISSFDLGGLATFRIQFAWIFVELRGSYGLLNLARYSGQAWNNVDTTVLVGWRFGERPGSAF